MTEYIITGGPPLRLRSQPTTQSETLGTMHNGARFTLAFDGGTEREGYRWYPVGWGGHDGWAALELVTYDEVADEPAPVSDEALQTIGFLRGNASATVALLNRLEVQLTAHESARIDVPFHSQVVGGALAHGNDCGPACCKMVLEYHGAITPSIDHIYDQMIPSGDRYTTFAQNVAYMERTGRVDVVFTRLSTWAGFWQRVRDEIDAGNPCIPVMSQTWLSERAGVPTSDPAEHFAVVVGYDGNSVYLNDPAQPNEATGKARRIPLSNWARAVGEGRHNLPWQMMIVRAI